MSEGGTKFWKTVAKKRTLITTSVGRACEDGFEGSLGGGTGFRKQAARIARSLSSHKRGSRTIFS